MKPTTTFRIRQAVLALATLAAAPAAGGAPPLPVDVDAAKALAKKSDCLKCHSVEVTKEGPPYREVAKKYKGKPDAEATLFKHMTTAPPVKVQGEEQDHAIVKTKKEADIYNLIRWILSQ